MATTTSIIQLRRGAYADFDPQKMKPGEIAVITSGDPLATDGKAIYMAFAAGQVKRLSTTDDIYDVIYNQTEEIAQQIKDDVADDVQRAEDAAQSIEGSAAQISKNTSDISKNASDISKNASDITELKEDLSNISQEPTIDKSTGVKLSAYINNRVTPMMVKSDTNTMTVYFPCIPNVTYTINKMLSARFRVGYTAAVPADSVQIYGVIADNEATSISLTTGSNAQYIVIYYYDGANDTESESTIYDSLEVTYNTAVDKVARADIETLESNVSDLDDDLDGKVDKQQAIVDAGKALIVGNDGVVYPEKIDTSGGLSDEAKTALLNCFQHVAWVDEHGQDYYDVLESALNDDESEEIWHYTTGDVLDVYDVGFYTINNSDGTVTYDLIIPSLSNAPRRTALLLEGDVPYGVYSGTGTYYPIPIPKTAGKVKAIYSNALNNLALCAMNLVGQKYTNVSDSATGYVSGGTVECFFEPKSRQYLFACGIPNTSSAVEMNMEFTFYELTAISSVFTQGQHIYNPDTPIDFLRQDLVVTAYYTDGSSEIINNYSMSGTLVVGETTITVLYGSKKSSFSVMVTEGTEYIKEYPNNVDLVVEKGIQGDISSATATKSWFVVKNNSSRAMLYTMNGENSICNESAQFVDKYLIKIPADATSITIEMQPTTLYAYLSGLTWHTDHYFRRWDSGGWVQNGATMSLSSFVRSDQRYLCTNLKANSEGTGTVNVSDIKITFGKD